MMANFQSAADLFTGWQGGVLSGKPPVLYPIGAGDLSRVEIGPGRVLLIGGPPGAGKTAFVMQAVVDALRLTDGLRAVVCNVEMASTVLMDRQLARLSGVPLDVVRRRQFGPEHIAQRDDGFATLATLADRLAFVNAPYNLQNVAETVDAFNGGLIVLDYIQRITPGGSHESKRSSVDASMDFIRQFADCGAAVVVVSAVSRGKASNGRSTYDAGALNLASFRESSELEFGADDAFILAPPDMGIVTLRHLKARHSETKDILLAFDGSRQLFKPIMPDTKGTK